MTKPTTPRVGGTMLRVLVYVANCPGCTQQDAAIYAGPNGSHAFGSRSVQRCLAAGLIQDTGSRKNAYSLWITAAGMDALDSSYLAGISA